MAVVHEGLGLKGSVTVTVCDAEGNVLQTTNHNKPTTAGMLIMAGWLLGTIINAGQGAIAGPTQIALGNGTGTPSADDTALWAEVATTRRACSIIRATQGGLFCEYVAQYLAADPQGPFTEAGLFGADGTLWAHVTLGSIVKTAAQTLTIQWKLQIKEG